MIKIGITGGIGAGKTTVAKIFANEYKIPVYYSDPKAKKILATNKELRKNLIKKYGKKIYDGNKISSEFFHNKIFNNKKTLKEFNSIIHKYVVDNFLAWVNRQKSKYILVEAAILIESGSYRLVDYIINVTAPVEIRKERIKKRSGWTDKQIKNVMNRQLSDEDRKSFSTFTIINDGKSDINQSVKIINSFLNNIKS